MSVTEEIHRRLTRLPEPLQAEVLNFVDYLLNRTARDDARQEDRAWFDLSMQSVMRDMDDDEGPDYSEDDLIERFP